MKHSMPREDMGYDISTSITGGSQDKHHWFNNAEIRWNNQDDKIHNIEAAIL